ncbi:methylated-DNA--[protein]-cysteine S-methyltransferase [Actinomyces gaoshouyii]|uniref:Putative methylated-DNA:protein-cysteine methyltransferase n=1 Tax=Actinomyces gaoshouyii TaxID=1960083 RepID=A0A8H9H9Q7_9ACTO|nr:methylated-DNA--[protein]-cysteine S-methyltransferase [Actinomyces gaoshouyii]ARD42586.1 cysteine methyltransferase [Actinomyces gaoshouyii]GGO95193.1 putative methylated-DNA:protein-cysteine methyltransferase [Actinomyces gaoshouyii]
MTRPQRDLDDDGLTASVATVPTADGPFTIIAGSAVLASGWTEDPAGLLALIHPGLRPGRLEEASSGSVPGALAQALFALEAYYDGELGAPAQVPVLQRSGPFRERAWEVLRGIGPGRLVSYAEYAALCGSPRAVRAAAGACAFNAAALFVPCHRVARADGSLGGFRYGPATKESLLAREGRRTRAPDHDRWRAAHL